MNTLHRQGLGYFRYQASGIVIDFSSHDLDSWINDGLITIYPIIYEDFLPVSAAGIFQSNLDERESQYFKRSPNRQAFEADLGCPVIDEFEFYADMQRQSLLSCLQELNVPSTIQYQILQQHYLHD